MTRDNSLGIHYEVHGHGYPLILSHPITASPSPNDPDGAVLKGYLGRLTDRYQVLVMDYPDLGFQVGRSKPMSARELTAQRVCTDLLSLADAAGFDRFAWWGFSWGGVIGLQLASRSDRVAALVCGGWPPLGAPYTEILRGVHAIAADPPADIRMPIEQFVTFYESIEGWPEAKAVQRIRCPRMTFVGCEDEVETGGVTLQLGATIHARRHELEHQGWRVVEFSGRDHSIYTDPDIVVPAVREFLDPVTQF